jgi:hypothetical protein
MLRLNDLLPLIHGEFKIIVHKLHDVPHIIGSGFNGTLSSSAVVDNMIVTRITHSNNIIVIEVFENS